MCSTRTYHASIQSRLSDQLIMKNKNLQFIVWLIVLTPIALFTSEWRVLQVLVLMLFFVFGIGFFFLKEYKKYIPFTAALFMALIAGIFGEMVLQDIGLL